MTVYFFFCSPAIGKPQTKMKPATSKSSKLHRYENFGPTWESEMLSESNNELMSDGALYMRNNSDAGKT